MLLVDPSGLAPEGWSEGNIDLANRFGTFGGGPENDITVNGKGDVVSVVENDQPHRLFLQTASGNKQIALNDPELDQIQLGDAKMNDRLVHFLTPENVNYIMYGAGVICFGAGTLSIIPELNAMIQARKSVGGPMDFFYSLLLPQLYALSMSADNYNSGLHYEDQYSNWDTGGGFVFFTGNSEYKAYNIPDAGNFLWGHSMTRLGGSSQLLWLGSNGNEMFGVGDVSADQRAIFRGSALALRIANPVANLLGYNSSRPAWFSTAGDQISNIRRGRD